MGSAVCNAIERLWSSMYEFKIIHNQRSWSTIGLKQSTMKDSGSKVMNPANVSQQNFHTRFSHFHAPPLEAGTTWSIVKFSWEEQYLSKKEILY